MALSMAAVRSIPLPRAAIYAERELRIWRRLWRGGLFSGLVSPILFLGAMGLGLGGLIDESSGQVDGLDYLVFVAPGLLAASAMQQAAAMALWPIMGGVKWLRHFHAAVATPLRPVDVYTGYLTWLGLNGVMYAVPFLVAAVVMGGVPSLWGVLAVPAAVMGALALAAPLMAFTMTQEDDAAFPAVMRVLVLPMFLFSGTFFPLSELPAALRPVAWCTPLWHSVELCRGATTGSIGWGAALGHLGFLAAFIGLGILWGARSFTRRLTP